MLPNAGVSKKMLAVVVEELKPVWHTIIGFIIMRWILEWSMTLTLAILATYWLRFHADWESRCILLILFMAYIFFPVAVEALHNLRDLIKMTETPVLFYIMYSWLVVGNFLCMLLLGVTVYLPFLYLATLLDRVMDRVYSSSKLN